MLDKASCEKTVMKGLVALNWVEGKIMQKLAQTLNKQGSS